MNSWSDSRGPFLCAIPKFPALGMKKEIGAYVAGFLFAVGWWMFIDGIILSTTYKELPVFIGIEDYVSGIIATLGMIIVSSIDPSLLDDDSMTFGGSGVAKKARALLFVGMTAMGGGIAGSISILCIKYIAAGVDSSYFYLGIAPVVQNVAILLSSAALWLSRSSESDIHYDLLRG
ncbi:UPF0220-domain-containing protein [Basidiobolus meristosporus CBS 931.73]|uniref:UPF0220-domain-containing protein n=1 Tax=Basidiobolus meristosporus CBS 931.73 TaxID=1314790 RepID=A0A1Y1YM28_9FUNG|nr:UPF0220-domain-containing protein [Basidiobolus meristosporus CBS 931.73]|eukprot:ORX99062.1 UPF0220-domain-containing protein [Basidiobolus meristosporus CBS 931.73]